MFYCAFGNIPASQYNLKSSPMIIALQSFYQMRSSLPSPLKSPVNLLSTMGEVLRWIKNLIKEFDV
jgi:hypothetical protein